MDDSCATILNFDCSVTVFAVFVSDDVCADRYVNCQNGGYRNPDDCRSCRCPDGYAGLFSDVRLIYTGGQCHGIHQVSSMRVQAAATMFLVCLCMFNSLSLTLFSVI